MKTILKYSFLFILLFTLSCNNDDDIIDTSPVAAFKINEALINEGQPAIFTDLSFDQNGTIVNWNWNFGNGITSTEQSPSIILPIGVYKVILSVTDNHGNVSRNDFSKTFEIVEPSTATIEPTLLWSFNLPAKVEDSSPAVGDDGTVYIGCSSKGGIPNVFAIKDGAQVWSYATDDINRSAPAIDQNGNIYIGSYDNNLYGFTSTGALALKVDIGNNAKYSGPVFGADGTIYIGSQSDDLWAIDPAGSVKWKFKTSGDVNGTPAIGSDGVIYIGSTDGYFYALNTDGTLKWKSKFGSWTATATAIGNDGTIYFAGEGNNLNPTFGGVLIAYNPADGTEKWRVNLTSKINQGGPAIAPDGTIYAGGADNKLVAYNPEDGSVKWSYPANGAIEGVPAIDNAGNIYFTDNEGYFHVIDADGNKKWKEKDLGTRSWSSPAIGSNGVIYVVADQDDGTSKLYAFKTKATGLASGGWPMRSKNAKHTGR